MSVQQVDRSGWSVFFDNFTKSLPGKRAEVEVASLDLGDQIEAEWAPLIGITYDHKDDLIEVALEGVDHLILEPKEVYVDFDVGGLIGVEVIDSEGARQIIKLKDPLALPAPRDQSATAPAR
jgi:hypothetical protein